MCRWLRELPTGRQKSALWAPLILAPTLILLISMLLDAIHLRIPDNIMSWTPVFSGYAVIFVASLIYMLRHQSLTGVEFANCWLGLFPVIMWSFMRSTVWVARLHIIPITEEHIANFMFLPGLILITAVPAILIVLRRKAIGWGELSVHVLSLVSAVFFAFMMLVMFGVGMQATVNEH